MPGVQLHYIFTAKFAVIFIFKISFIFSRFESRSFSYRDVGIVVLYPSRLFLHRIKSCYFWDSRTKLCFTPSRLLQKFLRTLLTIYGFNLFIWRYRRIYHWSWWCWIAARWMGDSIRSKNQTQILRRSCQQEDTVETTRCESKCLHFSSISLRKFFNRHCFYLSFSILFRHLVWFLIFFNSVVAQNVLLRKSVAVSKF